MEGRKGKNEAKGEQRCYGGNWGEDARKILGGESVGS